MHVPVMLAEAVGFLNVKPEGAYVDATAGFLGHVREIARRLTTGIVVANDRDPETLERARASAGEFAARIRFRHGEFSTLRAGLDELGIGKVDGLLADLGPSRFQLTEATRGFSILTDGPLDMRMDQTRQRVTAADLVNHSAEKALADLIYQLGEERSARRIARAIVRARPLRSTLHLASVVERVVPRTGRLHPATKTFLALRLAVNDELGELDRLLAAIPDLVASGGRVVVISFMSLEDRRVKESFRELSRQHRAEILTRRPVTPGEEEIRNNPASRSAKLRALEMR